MASGALEIINSNDPITLANGLTGPGITVISAAYVGSSEATGLFTNGPSQALNAGIVISTGGATSPATTSPGKLASADLGQPGNAICQSIAGVGTFDAAVLTVVVELDPALAGFSAYFQFASEGLCQARVTSTSLKSLTLV